MTERMLNHFRGCSR